MMSPDARSPNVLLSAAIRLASAAGAAATMFLLASLANVESMPRWLLLPVCVVAGITARNPAHGLVLLACLVPVATWLGRMWQPFVAWPEVMAVACAAGWFGRAVVRQSDRDDGLSVPVVLMALVVAGALAAQFTVDYQRFGPSVFWPQLWRLLRFDFFVTRREFEPIDAAVRLLESLLLFHAAALTARRSPDFPACLTRAIVLGAAAAAAINIYRLWLGALRLDSPLLTFADYLATKRLNVHYADLNAAGSYFVMALFPSVALALSRPRRGWPIAAILVTTGLWVSGSRAAMVAGVLAMGVPAWSWLRRGTRGRRANRTLATATLALVALAAAAGYYLPTRGTQQASSAALEVRLELAKTSSRMLATAPMFGIGIGQYRQRSGEFASPALLALFPSAQNENAHNNFFQILAELGIVGFGAFVWLLGAAFRRRVTFYADNPDRGLGRAAIAGLLAFGLTWLAGHPLLINEPAFTFWMLLGAVAGWGSHRADAPARSPRIAAVSIVAIAAVTIAASVPTRAARLMGALNLEHAGIGLSVWQQGPDGVRYRRAGASSTVFVPSYAHAITVPLRAVDIAATHLVTLTLDGRPADAVRVSGDRWYELRLLLPARADAPRFRRLDLRVTDASAADPSVLMIGKVEPR